MPVAPKKWTIEVVNRLRNDPIDGLLRGGYYTYLGFWHTLSSNTGFGRQIFDFDWDLLIILDACRVDALRTVAPEFDWLKTKKISSVRSRGSGSHEWLGRTFTRQQLPSIRETAYITPNGFAELAFIDGVYPPHHPVPFGLINNEPIQASDFGLLDLAWQNGWDETFETVLPRRITDRAIHINRSTEHPRLIVHYYQPHRPYLSEPLQQGREPTDIELSPFDHLKAGQVPLEKIWAMYLDNLRYILQEVSILLDNCNAPKTIITSDHGEMFGKFGLYEHPEGILHPNLRHVPWVELSSNDTFTHQPNNENLGNFGYQDTLAEEEVEDRLAALGYR